MFELSEEHRMLKDLVAKFVDQELIPLERSVLAREAAGGKAGLSDEEEDRILARCKELGLWSLDVPEELGGANLPTVALMAMNEELGRCAFPFTFPPDSPNLHMLMAVASPEQRRKYLEPYAAGTAKSAIAISEPGAGGDPAGMITRAVQDGNEWVINGRKIWVSRVPQADFVIVMARTGEGKRHDGVTAFIVEKNEPGFIIEREIQMIGGQRTYELVFEDCRIPAGNLVGEEGKGFDIAKRSLSEGRTMLSARSVGAAQKAMELAIEHGEQRHTFGKALLDHQALAFRLAQMSARTEAGRLLVYRCAWMLDNGSPAIRESSTAKFFCGEGLWQTVDDAIQMLGGYGYISHEYMIERIWRDSRVVRVYDGSSEVQQILISQRLRKGDIETRW